VKTPAFIGKLTASGANSYQYREFEYHVTDEKTVVLDEVQVGVEFAGATVDVLAKVGGVPFAIFVTYEDRPMPSVLSAPNVEKCGILELNVDALPARFRTEKKGGYKRLLRDFLEDQTEGKHWVYHPRETQAKLAAAERRDSWLEQQALLATKAPHRASEFGRRPPASSHTTDWRSSIQDEEKATTTSRRRPASYRCVLCNRTWMGASRDCPNCGTHLYTTEVTQKPESE